MRLVRASVGHVPAHARSAATAVTPQTRDRRAPQTTRRRRWTPVLIIGAIYLVAIVINEWRLQQHVQELRDRAPAQIVEAPSTEVGLAEAG